MGRSSAAALRSRPQDAGGTERHAAPRPLTVEWVHSVAQVEALAEEWVALEAAVQDRTVFSTFDYLVTWYRNYAGEYGGDPLLGIARRGSRLVGVAPLVVRAGRVGRIPVTRVHFAVHDNYAGEFLVEDDHPETVAAFLDSLVGAVKFDLICLNGVDPASDRFRVLAEAAARHRLAIELTDHPNAFVDLRGGYAQYCNAMSRNFRRTVKRQAQRVASAGQVTVDSVHLAKGLEKLEGCIVRLFEITEASYKLQGQRLADHHRNCLAELARRFGPREMLHLSILSIGGRDAAVVMGLVERGCYYDVTLAYVEEFAELSPGSFLIQAVLEDLAAAGVHTVVSHGAHDYKRRWATAFKPSTRMFLFSPGVRGTAARSVRFGLAPIWRRFGAPEP
jgi:CelD/BcsL family acetyltransferase involved in cellulose biosynthesis